MSGGRGREREKKKKQKVGDLLDVNQEAQTETE
jgi:hypothetical protein